MEEFDYVIVGAGAAGCVLANRLSDSGKNTVAVIEAGGQDNHIWIKIPAGFNKTVYNDKLNWGYETAPGPFIDNRRIKYPRGKVLGGSGSINGHLYVRGQAADYDMWAQLGCRGWSWSDVLPYFKRAESRIGGSDDVRGRSGPAQHRGPARSALAQPCLHGGQRGGRPETYARLQRRRPGRHAPLSADDAERPALEPGRRLSAPGAGTPEPESHHPRPGRDDRPRGQARRRHHLPPGRAKSDKSAPAATSS